MAGRRQPDFFEQVRARAAKHWDILEGNPELAGPWRRLFQQVQRPRQVLSELLQNADDAGATWARATIRDRVFVFEHDGADFDEGDFSSLCSFGFSRKRLLHTIGFWGVGFKSLFSLGPRVEVVTPTVACFFHEHRFTEPVWIEDAPDVEQVTIRVRIEDSQRQEAVSQEFGRWCAMPLSIALFGHLRCIELQGRRIEVVSTEAGPVAETTRRLTIEAAGSRREILVVSSAGEPFPPEAIEEVRRDRGHADELDLPPAKVTAIIGLDARDTDRRIYTVLPTEQRIGLPLSCNAPFVPDPGRTSIKDPVVSPTNHWLLERVGRLVGETLLAWLGNTDLPRAQRAEAYRLLLAQPQSTGSSASAAADRLISEEFNRSIEGTALALDTNGELGARSETACIDSVVMAIWGPEVALGLFAPEQTRVLAPEVVQPHRDLLERRGYVRTVRRDAVVERLCDADADRAPRPGKIELLALLWCYVYQAVRSDWDREKRLMSMLICPATDSAFLHRPHEVLRVCSRPAECTNEDWDFLITRATVLDPRWAVILDQAEADGEAFCRAVEAAAGSSLGGDAAEQITAIAAATRLNSPCGLAELLHHAAESVFGEAPNDEEAAVRLVRIAFRGYQGPLTRPRTWRFQCRGGEWRNAEEGVLIDTYAHLLPESFVNAYVLSEVYDADLSETEAVSFRKWLSADSGLGLMAFPAPKRRREQFNSRQFLRGWISDHGGHLARDYRFPYKTSRFECHTHSWPEELVAHWDACSSERPDTWASVLEAVLESGWLTDEEIRAAKAKHLGSKYAKDIECGDLFPDWLMVLRERPCIRDEHGLVHKPSEVYRRTTATENIAQSLGRQVVLLPSPWERDDLAWLWDALRVQKAFSQYEWVLDRIRALARVESPPIHHLADLYELLAGMWSDLSPDQEEAVRAAVAHEPLVWTDYGWCAGSDCFQSNPDDIPGQPVIHQELLDCKGLWDRLEIAQAPTAECAFQWLKGLPLGQQVLDADLRRVERILARYAADALQRRRAWLDVNNSWVAVTDLRWACGDPALADGLLENVRRRCGRFDMVPAEQRADLLRRADLHDLGQCLRGRRVGGDLQGDLPDANLEPLGDVLARLADGSGAPDATAHDREVGARLKVSRCVRVSGLQVQWFVDGDPASAIEPALAVWEGDHLYVEGSLAKAAKAAISEICRHLVTDQAREFVEHCLARTSEWIQEYATENLDLELYTRRPDAPEPPDDSPRTDEFGVQAPEEEAQPKDSETPDDGAVGAGSQGAGADEEGTVAGQQEAGGPPRPREVRGTGSVSRPDRLAAYFRGKGFSEAPGQYLFRHPDGRVIRHEREKPFPYVESKNGQDMRWYYVVEGALPDGVEVPADTWDIGCTRGEAAVLLVFPAQGRLEEVTWAELQERVKAKQIALYTASYRLRLSAAQGPAVSGRT